MEEKYGGAPVSRPGEPTTALPGSPRKIRVLMERAARKEPLFHPQDGVNRFGAHAIPLAPDELPRLAEGA